MGLFWPWSVHRSYAHDDGLGHNIRLMNILSSLDMSPPHQKTYLLPKCQALRNSPLDAGNPESGLWITLTPGLYVGSSLSYLTRML